VAIGIVVGVVVIGLALMVVWFSQKRKKRRIGGNYGYPPAPSPFASSQNSGNA